jgi:hypothetical protein
VPDADQQAEGQPRQVRIFSDEKIFTVDVAVNRCNSRYLTDLPVAYVDSDVPISPKSKAPLKQMVLGVIGSDGQKCPIVFVSAGESVNADVYLDLLRKHVVPWIKRRIRTAIMSFSRIRRRLTPPGPPSSSWEKPSRNSDSGGFAAIFAGPESTGLFGLERFAGEGPSYAPHKFCSPTPVHHQAVEPDVAGLCPPNLPLFPPPPGGRHGKKWRLYQIGWSAKDQDTPTSPFQGYQKLQ